MSWVNVPKFAVSWGNPWWKTSGLSAVTIKNSNEINGIIHNYNIYDHSLKSHRYFVKMLGNSKALSLSNCS